MANRVTAAEMYRITSDDLRNAIARLDENTAVHDFADSTRFDVLVEGFRRYAPKAVVGVAAERSFGRILKHNEFSGGESSSSFRLLSDRGFELVTKSRTSLRAARTNLT